MELNGKKVILLTEQMFNDHEFWYPYYRLKEGGAEVTVVSTMGGVTYTGKDGTTATSDTAAKDISPESYDGIVIPGGFAPDFMRRSPEMVSIVREMAEAGKLVAAICHGGWMLASAKILQGKTVTSFFAIRDDLVHAGATWVDEPVVTDGKLVTSRVPGDLPAFMRTVVAQLQ